MGEGTLLVVLIWFVVGLLAAIGFGRAIRVCDKRPSGAPREP